jgi:hypothetical protein
VRGALVEGRRWGRRTFTEYDGLLGAAVPPPPTLAPTQLETYGLCPFKFFGERILGVREIQEPEAVETITPLDRGALLHDILDRFFSQLVQDGLVPVRAEGLDECRRRLRTIADEVCAGFEKSGAVGYRFMWEVEKARILTDLEGILSFELAAPPGFVPAYFEARFGPTPAWVTPPPGSMPHPLELPVDGRPMRFTGYIDRIDLDQRGGARVIDYKTGMIYGEKSDQFRGGQSLQLPTRCSPTTASPPERPKLSIIMPPERAATSASASAAKPWRRGPASLRSFSRRSRTGSRRACSRSAPGRTGTTARTAPSSRCAATGACGWWSESSGIPPLPP